MTTRKLAEIDRARYALVELDRARAQTAVPLLRRAGATLVSRRLAIWRLHGDEFRRLLPHLRRLRALRAFEADVRHAPNRMLARFVDPLVPLQWWRARIGVEGLAPPGPGMSVTVIDSGLDLSHPEFVGRPNNVVLNEQDVRPFVDEEHGTAVSSVVAAPENGVGTSGIYPQAVLRVWDAGDLSISSVIAGLERAVDAGPSVINMSLSSDEYSPLEEEAVLVAFGTGSIVVASSGNEYAAGNPLRYPASLNHVLTVAATDQADGPSYFSSSSLAVDLAAPGEDVPVAVPFWYSGSGYSLFDGTSFSSPLVAGATAWVWTRRPNLDHTQIFDLMRFSARDIWGSGYDEDTGFGMLDVRSALANAAPASDHQEPNDDIDHVRPNGLFADGDEPLTWRSRPSANIRARLDATEDPADVYRVWIPARKTITVTLKPNRDVDLRIFTTDAKTIYRRTGLISRSERIGAQQETLGIENPASFGQFVYAAAYLPDPGPLSAAYRLRITTSR